MCAAGQENLCYQGATPGSRSGRPCEPPAPGRAARSPWPVFGGLGHLAVKLATALGAEVTVLSRTAGKADDARKLGAVAMLNTGNVMEIEQAHGRFDVILDTIPAPHDIHPLLRMAALDGTSACSAIPPRSRRGPRT